MSWIRSLVLVEFLVLGLVLLAAPASLAEGDEAQTTPEPAAEAVAPPAAEEAPAPPVEAEDSTAPSEAVVEGEAPRPESQPPAKVAEPQFVTTEGDCVSCN